MPFLQKINYKIKAETILDFWNGKHLFTLVLINVLELLTLHSRLIIDLISFKNSEMDCAFFKSSWATSYLSLIF